MASTNQSPFYRKAEANFLSAGSDEEKIEALEEMIRECPKHKSSEKMLAQLKTRYKKFKAKLEKSKKSGKSKKQGIKKEDMQAVIIGETQTGKSRLLSALTNAHPKIGSEFEEHTTKTPIIGMMDYAGTKIQLIENPSIKSQHYDKGLTNCADTILILVTDLEQIKKAEKEIKNTRSKRIIIFMNDKPEKPLRKISATLQSKKYNFIITDLENKENLEELKFKIFESFNKIRIYTKEPGKEPDKERPLILEPNSTIKHAARRIIKNLDNLKETKIWGPSSKFPGQKVGLQHKLKDLDIVEFKTK